MSNVTVQAKKSSDRKVGEELRSNSGSLKTTGGIGVIGSNYNSDITIAIAATAEVVAIPSGSTMVWVCNESVTTLESVRFEFNNDGTSSAVVTRGFRVSPGIATAAGDNGPKCLAVPVPAVATHMSYISEAGTPTINVVWGG
ncbi:MAG: hypothetical protein OEX12_07005 [Gammaproteobacteria bacterium]|nr:hypothetical protein [Gammaproteobacteria bacterium]